MTAHAVVIYLAIFVTVFMVMFAAALADKMSRRDAAIRGLAISVFLTGLLFMPYYGEVYVYR